MAGGLPSPLDLTFQPQAAHLLLGPLHLLFFCLDPSAPWLLLLQHSDATVLNSPTPFSPFPAGPVSVCGLTPPEWELL